MAIDEQNGPAGPPTTRLFDRINATASSIVDRVEPIKKLMLSLVLVIGIFSSGVGYAVNYFATRAYVERLECMLDGKIELAQLSTSRHAEEIAARTRLAGLFASVTSAEFIGLKLSLLSDVNELKDRQLERIRQHNEKWKDVVKKCNPGANVP